MKILTARQMGEVDRLSTEKFEIPSILLMENAGRSFVDELQKALPRLDRARILVLCGRGNNGGDGFVAARHLRMRGARPEIVLLAEPTRLKGDALINYEIARAVGLPVTVLPDPAETVVRLRAFRRFDVVVDALFGTGLSHPIGPELSAVVDWVNSESEAFIAAVDIPSGLMSDSAAISGPSVKAALTVTFSALKPALVFPPASDCAGRVAVVPIGSPESLINSSDHRLNLTDASLVSGVLKPRPRGAHKGTFGHVYVAAGSRGKSGAAIMTGLAALRAGAGLVTLYVPEGVQKELVGKVPELMIEPLGETGEGVFCSLGADVVLESLARADAVVVGPGVSTAEETREFVTSIVRNSPVPVVLDADGLNTFAGRPYLLRNERDQPVVITPHPGEMARLAGKSIGEIQADRLTIARDFAAAHGCVTVLKGFQTVIALPSSTAYINGTGNPGMATGGSGDVLAGIIGRFVAGWRRGEKPSDRERLGDYVASAVHIHGLAGDLAAEEKGEESLIATDLIPFLPPAFKRVARG